jgi:hypothetical protein
VSSVGFQALAKLRNLREVMSSDATWQQEKCMRLMRLCVQCLPHLRVFGCNSGLDSHCIKYGVTHNEMMLQTPKKLNLESLALEGDVEPALGWELPELQGLHLRKPSGDVAGLCDRFQNLSFLSFCEADMDVIESVLQHVGQRLSKLEISEARPASLLGTAVALCPNLKILSFECGYGDDLNLPAECLRFLEEVSMDIYCTLFPPGFIVQVSFPTFYCTYIVDFHEKLILTLISLDERKNSCIHFTLKSSV